MALATIAGTELTAALRPQLVLMVDDLRVRLAADHAELARWRAAHDGMVREQRTAGSWTDWSEDQLTQAAVGWLLTSVFVRFCEDNLLLGEGAVWIAGPTPMLRSRAVDAENAFYRENQNCSYREWLEQAFSALREQPATLALVDEHAALNIMSPSSDAVNALIEFWRRTNDEGELVWSFRDPLLSTRFLGDLYQDLSDFAKKKYALLQTPEFVQEFILDQTLEPALKDRPLEGFTLIDPTCGSGHFLLGGFARLVERWHQHSPGLDLRTRVDNALSSIHGVDVNPFAVAIAKFRLIVAALQECGETTLINAPMFALNLAAGDSLLHGREQGDGTAFDYGDVAFDKDAVLSGVAYRTEDVAALRTILASGQYDAVVGNPPYIAVKDKALNARYREIYDSCKGKYALTVPFMEKFFTLAKGGDRAGWVGQITSNSFMKREFGAPLIEEFLAKKDLRLVADTSGVYIPGHGTPTVIIVGRNHLKVHDTVRAVLGIQGEPGVPDNPSKGRVWTAIRENLEQPGYQDRWVSITDLPRGNLRLHPWSLSGGGAVDLLHAIESRSALRLADATRRVGVFGMTNCDAAMMISSGRRERLGLEAECFRRWVVGEEIRDYGISPGQEAWFPYSGLHTLRALSEFPRAAKYLWPNRTELGNRVTFNKITYFAEGRPWYEWHQVPKNDDPNTPTITYAEIATHNHFVMDRGGKVFNRSAPVIKLPSGSTDDDHLRLLGVLNSSTACFWLRQNCYPKGGDPVGNEGARVSSELWSDRYQFNGTMLKGFPLPLEYGFERAKNLDSLARELARLDPAEVIASHGASELVIDTARADAARLRALLIAEQEELDWEVYHHYGLVKDRLVAPVGEAPGIGLGQRAFEIALARLIEAGEDETAWFTRHSSMPINEVPSHWRAEYRQIVEQRLEVIASNPFIRLLERPEYKRRWAGDSWDVKLQAALRDWLLDRLEARSLWFTPHGTPFPRSVGELAGAMEKTPEFLSALDLWAGRRDVPVTTTLVKLLSDQSVPYLGAMRYKPSGLRKRVEWERVWEMQRQEDIGLIDASVIPVPPKYSTSDFVKPSYWSHRGRLDVSQERFIAYLGAGRVTDPTPLLGWAGWDHAQQGLALATIYAAREAEGMALDELVPVVAGMAELLPWVRQWHSGVDANLGVDLAQYLEGQLREKSATVGMPIADLHTWRPVPSTRGRKSLIRKASS